MHLRLRTESSNRWCVIMFDNVLEAGSTGRQRDLTEREEKAVFGVVKMHRVMPHEDRGFSAKKLCAVAAQREEKMMKNIFKRVLAFVLSVAMVMTMANWSDFATTVAKAATTDAVYIYDPFKLLAGKDSITVTLESGSNSKEVVLTRNVRPSDATAANWFGNKSAETPVDTGSYAVKFAFSDTVTAQSTMSNVESGEVFLITDGGSTLARYGSASGVEGVGQKEDLDLPGDDDDDDDTPAATLTAGRYVLRPNSTYFVGLNADNTLYATTNPDMEVQFDVVVNSDNTVSLKVVSTGKYLCGSRVGENAGKITATSNSVGDEWERFDATAIAGGAFVLSGKVTNNGDSAQAAYDGGMVQFKLNGNTDNEKIMQIRNDVKTYTNGTWEPVVFVPALATGVYTMKVASDGNFKDRYITIPSAWTAPLYAKGTELTNREKMEIVCKDDIYFIRAIENENRVISAADYNDAFIDSHAGAAPNGYDNMKDKWETFRFVKVIGTDNYLMYGTNSNLYVSLTDKGEMKLTNDAEKAVQLKLESSTATAPKTHYTTVYFYNGDDWTDVKAYSNVTYIEEGNEYIYTGANAGKKNGDPSQDDYAAATPGEGKWYSVSIPDDYDGFIFKGMKNGEEKSVSYWKNDANKWIVKSTEKDLDGEVYSSLESATNDILGDEVNLTTTIYMYVPQATINKWNTDMQKLMNDKNIAEADRIGTLKPAVIYKYDNTESHTYTMQPVEGKDGWFSYQVLDKRYDSITKIFPTMSDSATENAQFLSNRLPGGLGWGDYPAYDGLGDHENIKWVDVTGGKAAFLAWADSSFYKDFNFTEFERPEYMDVWYYNPNWKGEKVTLNYRSTATGNVWEGDGSAPQKEVDAIELLPGWFHVNGRDNGLYKYDADTNPIVDISFSVKGKYGSAYYNTIDEDKNKCQAILDKPDMVFLLGNLLHNENDSDVNAYAHNASKAFSRPADLLNYIKSEKAADDKFATPYAVNDNTKGTAVFTEAAYPFQEAHSLDAYYYNGAAEAVNAVSNTQPTTNWQKAYADVYVYPKGSTKAYRYMTAYECVADGTEWYSISTGLDAAIAKVDASGNYQRGGDFENGVYVQFKSHPDVKSGTGMRYNTTVIAQQNQEITAAYNFRNNYRKYANSKMNIYTEKDRAKDSLNPQKDWYENEKDDKFLAWIYIPEKWDKYYTHVSYDGTTYTESVEMAYYDQYEVDKGGWYLAEAIRTKDGQGVKKVFFSNKSTPDAAADYRTEVYDVTGRTAEILYFDYYKLIEKGRGWSTSTAAIQQLNDLKGAAPSSYQLTMPLTILDYNADNLLFEYDMKYWLNMTLVLGNENNGNGMSGMGVTKTGEWQEIDSEPMPGTTVPHLDRNGAAYVIGVLDEEAGLVNGNPVYTKKAIGYVSMVLKKGYDYWFHHNNAGEFDHQVQNMTRTQLYKDIMNKLHANTANDAAFSTFNWTNDDPENNIESEYTKSKEKVEAFMGNSANMGKTILDASFTNMTFTDYAYYVMNYMFNTNSAYNKDYDMYDHLVLQKVIPGVYGFYANYQTSQPTSYNIKQNYGPNGIIYDTDKRVIMNNLNGAETFDDGQYDATIGFFPYNKVNMDKIFHVNGDPTKVDRQSGTENEYYYYKYNELGDTPVEFIDNNKFRYKGLAIDAAQNAKKQNYNYALKSNGRFLFDYSKDLYFTFTGDDDVVLYIDGKLLMDLSGAHQAVSDTIYLNDLVDDGVLNFDKTTPSYHDFDFFYLERHTTWSNIIVQTNIDVFPTAGQVQKDAFLMDGTKKESGETVEDNTPIYYEISLKAPAAANPEYGTLKKLTFDDDSLDFHLSEAAVRGKADADHVLGSYQHAEKVNGETVYTTVYRTLSDLTITVGSVTYRTDYTGTDPAKQTLTYDVLADLLKNGLLAEEMILISGIRDEVTKTISGPVVAFAEGLASDGPKDVISRKDHTLYQSSGSIKVTEGAKNGVGTDLPSSTVLQSGSKPSYVLKLENNGGAVNHDLSLKDDVLGVSFGPDGATLNQWTTVDDIKIVVDGTGITDNTYTVTLTDEEKAGKSAEEIEALKQAKLDTLVSNLTKLTYPKNASITILGVRYPITQETRTKLEGEADFVIDLQSPADKGWKAFGTAYAKYLADKAAYDVAADKAGLTAPTEPVYTLYVKVDGRTPQNVENLDAYAEEYKNFIADFIENGKDITKVTEIPSLAMFANDDAKDDDDYLLDAVNNSTTIYAEVGQTVPDISVVEGKTVSLSDGLADTNGAVAESDFFDKPIDLKAGSHDISIFKPATDTSSSFDLYEVELYKVDEVGNTAAEPSYKLTVTDTNSVIPVDAKYVAKDGDVDAHVVMSSGSAANFAITLPESAAGQYKVKIKVKNRNEEGEQGDVVSVMVDYVPGNYVLVDAEGKLVPMDGVNAENVAEYAEASHNSASYIVDNMKITINNVDAYPAITVDTTGKNITAGSTVEVKPGVDSYGLKKMYYTYEGNTVTSATVDFSAEPNLLTVVKCAVEDSVYVLDYGLRVELSDPSEGNGMFEKDTLNVQLGDRAYLHGFAMVDMDDTDTTNDRVVKDAAYEYLYERTGYSNVQAPLTGDAQAPDQAIAGKYGQIELIGTTEKTQVIYKLTKFFEGIERYKYAVQVGAPSATFGADGNANKYNATPVMEANVTIIPASIIYYEDNFEGIKTTGTIVGEDPITYTSSYWSTDWNMFSLGTGQWVEEINGYLNDSFTLNETVPIAVFYTDYNRPIHGASAILRAGEYNGTAMKSTAVPMGEISCIQPTSGTVITAQTEELGYLVITEGYNGSENLAPTAPIVIYSSKSDSFSVVDNIYFNLDSVHDGSFNKKLSNIKIEEGVVPVTSNIPGTDRTHTSLLPVGNYSYSQLRERGIMPKTITKIKVPTGYKITVYDEDGVPFVMTAAEEYDFSQIVNTPGATDDENVYWASKIVGIRVDQTGAGSDGTKITFGRDGGGDFELAVGDYSEEDLKELGIQPHTVWSVLGNDKYVVTFYDDFGEKLEYANNGWMELKYAAYGSSGDSWSKKPVRISIRKKSGYVFTGPGSGYPMNWDERYKIGMKLIGYTTPTYRNKASQTVIGGDIGQNLDSDRDYTVQFTVSNIGGGHAYVAFVKDNLSEVIGSEIFAPIEVEIPSAGTYTAPIKLNEAQKNALKEVGASLAIFVGANQGERYENFTFTDIQLIEKVPHPMLQGNGLQTQYGYDNAYTNMPGYSSNGYTTLSNGQTFVFEFQGTGFDIMTGTADANLEVSVYDACEHGILAYNYNANAENYGFIGIAKVNAAGTPIAPADAPLKKVYVSAYYENGSSLDQVPLVSVDCSKFTTPCENKKYIVLVTRMGGNDTTLHIDGVRIYNPISTTDTEVSDAYAYAAGEKNADLTPVREMIFGKGYSFSKPEGSERYFVQYDKNVTTDVKAGLVRKVGENAYNMAIGNTVVEWYTNSVTSKQVAEDRVNQNKRVSDLYEYAASGPNNELYMNGEDNIFATAVSAKVTGATMIQIGLKKVNTDNAAVQYLNKDGEWVNVPGAEKLTTATEMYYRLPDMDELYSKEGGKKVLMLRVFGPGLVSFTNIKSNNVKFESVTAADITTSTVVPQDDETLKTFGLTTGVKKGNFVTLTFNVTKDVKDFTLDYEGTALLTVTGEAIKRLANDVIDTSETNMKVAFRAFGDRITYVVKFTTGNAGDYYLSLVSNTGFNPVKIEVM